MFTALILIDLVLIFCVTVALVLALENHRHLMRLEDAFSEAEAEKAEERGNSYHPGH
jgi:hypothetical protein